MAPYLPERVVHHPALTLKYVVPSRRPGLRVVVGVKVSKKATERNLLKRRLKEIWRKLSLPPDVAATFYTKADTLKLSFTELATIVTKLTSALTRK